MNLGESWALLRKLIPVLALEYMLTVSENKYFDRKSARIKPTDLAQDISGFANADGATIVIGINDKTRKLEGINAVGEAHINELVNACNTCCRPMPECREEFLDIINSDGQPDRLLLLHIAPSKERIIRTTSDQTYLRIGDKTKPIVGENLRNLEYSKGTRHYEDEFHLYARIEDMDHELLGKYKSSIGAAEMSDEQVLKTRGFLQQVNGEWRLTNAAVLLFAENIRQFYPNCRVRFLRYDGVEAKVGVAINLIKDVSIEYPLLRLIDKTNEFIRNQLRDFTRLNTATGKFEMIPEYPEFAWAEGVINAITHRDYAMTGLFIKVTMFDDRLEIESPGQLPGIVTLKTIRESRFSRNPTISRVLTECGWVRELNEGVPRIYADMKEFFLDEPEYSEPPGRVRLVLRNNIVARQLRQTDSTVNAIGQEAWEQLDELERKLMVCLSSRGAQSTTQLARILEKSDASIRRRLNNLLQQKLIKANGNSHDPMRTYQLLI